MSHAKKIIKSFIVEKEYTDNDAIKDYQRMISKDKERIIALKKDIKDDQEMIKDKTQKMNDAEDADLKKRYAANIEKIKARIKATEASIKEWQEDIKMKEKKLADAKSDLSKKESLSEEKDPKIKKMEDEVKKLKDIKDDAYEKMMKEKEKYGSSDAWFHQDIVSYRKLHDAHSDANAKWDKAYFKLQKMKGNR
jgi:chromosome segregation ATPase